MTKTARTKGMNMSNLHFENVKSYYQEVLKTKEDLQTTACCTAEMLPSHVRNIASLIHPEVIEKFYGCGSPIPSALEGCTILDLGCGTGRDCFILSKLVGESGRVIGVDMTDGQLAVARKHQEYHAKQFGHKSSNIRFVQGYIENLKALDIADNSVDVVVSNCVLNLSPDKDAVFGEIFRVLKPGGELYFSDVFSNRRLSQAAKTDKVMVGECLGGAMYTEDFRRLMAKVGCSDSRRINRSIIELRNPDIMKLAAGAVFYSDTIRAFKLNLEDKCEDYGQVAWYKGTIPDAPRVFNLDDHHSFEVGRPLLVCSNTAKMLAETRFSKHFKIEGNTSTHYGLFDCGPTVGVNGVKSGTIDPTACGPAGCC